MATINFIDRYYYREHKYIINKYPLYIDNNNHIKSDDKINFYFWNYLNY